MSGSKLKETLEIFDSRLASLSAIMTRGRAELFPGSDDMSPILSARLAEDMLAFPYQIVFACNQPNHFLAWLKDEDLPAAPEGIEDMSYADLETHIADCRASLAGAKVTLDDAALNQNKVIKVPPNISFTLSGSEYVDEWLMPNFYFHYVTAYNIFRSRGLKIGKADYMAHLMPRITGR